MGVIVKPNTFSANTTISSSQMNANFDTIYNDYNGGIAAANLATDSVTTAKIADSNVTTAKIADSNVTTAKILDSNVTNAKVAAGFVVQTVSTPFTAVATGTTVLPLDDTIPQITEGVEFMTQAITPKSATNILVIQATFLGSYSIAQDISTALFQDATANALAANSTFMATGNGRVVLSLTHSMVAGTTSSTTFRLRAGGAAAGTITFNGFSGGRLFGAITKSSMVITEYKA